MNRNSSSEEKRNSYLTCSFFPLPKILDLRWWTFLSYCHNTVSRNIASQSRCLPVYWRIYTYLHNLIFFLLLAYLRLHRYWIFRKADNQKLVAIPLYSIHPNCLSWDGQRDDRRVCHHQGLVLILLIRITITIISITIPIFKSETHIIITILFI